MTEEHQNKSKYRMERTGPTEEQKKHPKEFLTALVPAGDVPRGAVAYIYDGVAATSYLFMTVDKEEEVEMALERAGVLGIEKEVDEPHRLFRCMSPGHEGHMAYVPESRQIFWMVSQEGLRAYIHHYKPEGLVIDIAVTHLPIDSTVRMHGKDQKDLVLNAAYGDDNVRFLISLEQVVSELSEAEQAELSDDIKHAEAGRVVFAVDETGTLCSLSASTSVCWLASLEQFNAWIYSDYTDFFDAPKLIPAKS